MQILKFDTTEKNLFPFFSACSRSFFQENLHTSEAELLIQNWLILTTSSGHSPAEPFSKSTGSLDAVLPVCVKYIGLSQEISDGFEVLRKFDFWVKLAVWCEKRILP